MKGERDLTPRELSALKSKLIWFGWKPMIGDVWIAPGTHMAFSVYTAAKIAGIFPHTPGCKNESLHPFLMTVKAKISKGDDNPLTHANFKAMTKDRWIELMQDDDCSLTPEEIQAGWHFCAEWDNLLIGPGMGELENFVDPESLKCMCGLSMPPSYKPCPVTHEITH